MEKRQKRIIKLFLAGSLITVTLVNLAPNIEYSLTKAYLSNKISVSEENEINKIKIVCDLFKENINKNNNLDKDTKNKVIDAFNKYFLYRYADELSEEAIINMCAVARTESIEEFSNKSKSDIYLGSYDSFYNSIELLDTTIDDEYDKKVWAHEQLHAMFKNGWFLSGFRDYFKGKAIDEGMVSCLIKDESYNADQGIIKALACLIGFDKLKSYYFDCNLDGLVNELSKYCSEDKVLEMIYTMDYNLDVSSKIMKLERNGGDSAEIEQLKADYQKKWLKIKGIVVEMYEHKLSRNIEEDEFGKILLDSVLTDPYDYKEKYYKIDLDDNNDIIITQYVCNCFAGKFYINFDDISTFSVEKKSSYY